MSKGIFITTEGTDGSGKSTQIELINQYLIEKGREVVFVREPGGTTIGEKIRDIILDNKNRQMSYVAEMMLYASSRAQLIDEKIITSISEGKVVICDRFVDSSLVYQGLARGLGLDIVQKINEVATRGITPDITFFFSLDPHIALNRILQKKADRLESEGLDFQMKVYEGYKYLVNIYPDRIKEIDSSGTVEEVFDSVKKHLDEITL